MSKQNRLLALKKVAGRLGVAGISALICLPAGAQIQPNPGIKNSSANDERVHIAQSPQEERQAPADVPTTKPGTSSPEISPDTSKPGMSPSAAISQAELQKFANAVKKLQPIQQSAQREVTQVIQQQGMSEKRFDEIYQARQNPQTQPAATVTSEETKKFEQTTAKLQEIQQVTEAKMLQVVREESLEAQRFNQIFAAVRQNPTLLRKVQELIRS